MSKWQKTQWEEFVEICEKLGRSAEKILQEAVNNLVEGCPFCVARNPLRNSLTEGHCWHCGEFLLSEEDLNG